MNIHVLPPCDNRVYIERLCGSASQIKDAKNDFRFVLGCFVVVTIAVVAFVFLTNGEERVDVRLPNRTKEE